MSNRRSMKQRIEKFAYTDESLDIRFVSGNALRFERVPEILYRLLSKAYSADRFYDKYIRHRYPNRQIDNIYQHSLDK